MNTSNQTDNTQNTNTEEYTWCCDDCGVEQVNDTWSDYDESRHNTNSGDVVCQDCLDHHYCVCYGCDEYIIEDDAHHASGDYYCEDCFYDSHFYCEGCGESEHLDYQHYDDNEGCGYCENCYEESGDEYDWHVYSNNFVRENSEFACPVKNLYGKDTFDLIPSQRYQGIEIEANHCGDYTRETIERAIAVSIDDSRNESLFASVNEQEYPDWFKITGVSVVSDGSIIGGDDQHGNEYVAIPRRGDQLYTDMVTITDTLVNYGHYISKKCGYHLHIDIRDYDYYHLTCLMGMVKLIEPHIYSWVPQSRLRGNWCRPISQSWYDFLNIHDRENFIEIYYDEGQRFKYEKYHDKRYHGLNLHSHFGNNQGLELRYHGGTLNPTKMLHWSILWGQIVDKCYELGNELKSYSDRKEFFKPVIFDEESKGDIKGYRNPTMDINNLFDAFDIPQETRHFYALRQKEIENNPNTEATHFANCFGRTSHFVEFDKATKSFKTIQKLPHRVGGYGTLGELTYDDISNHYEIAS